MNKAYYLVFLRIGLLLLFPLDSISQSHFNFVPNTGSNMTVLVKADILSAAGEQGLETGDEIGVYAAGGPCVGSIALTGKNIAITIWGDNDQTQKIDGAKQGEDLFFRVWSLQNQKEYSASVEFTTGSSVFYNDGIGIISKLVVAMPALTQPLEDENNFTPQANTSSPTPTAEKSVLTGKIAATNTTRNVIVSTGATVVDSAKKTAPTSNSQPLPFSTRRMEPLNITWPPMSSKATKYWLEIATDSTMKNAIIDSSLKSTDTNKTLTGFDAGTYWWRVRSYTRTGWGKFSNIQKVILKQTMVTPSPFAFSWQPADSLHEVSMIIYTLPIVSKVLFKLNNKAGKTIRKIYENQQAGTHIISTDPKLLGKGSYFYTLEVGEFVVKGYFAIKN